MHRLPFIIVLLFFVISVSGQSPHGNSLKLDCAQCHNPEGWTVDLETIKFDHNSTNFELEGSHEITDCKSCHTSLVFNEAPTDCISCHTDIHSQSVGNDCIRCHTSENWLVFTIPEIHEENGFPLIGTHSNLSCVECHTNESSLIFNRLGNECIECHRDDYMATQSPNHLGAGFSTDCIECHSTIGFDWGLTGVNHDFFPLTMGHDIQDCSRCHDITNFSDISADCFSCHEIDFNQTSNPNHTTAGFPTDCIECHTTAPGWTPATINHDFFPLTMGHDIQDCNACHTGGIFTGTPTDCFACHDDDYNQTTNPNHTTAGFPTDCATCHSTNPGWMPAVVDHDFFPLTQGHDIQDCNACHAGGIFTGTPTDCFACHDDDFNQTANPNHTAAGFPTDCVQCHTTNPGWMPTTFNHDFFPLVQGHNINDCVACHVSEIYINTPTDCFACHQDDYNQTNDPDHQAANFPTDCVECHTLNPGWMPSTFDHDNQYFPIYSGKHDNVWSSCIECHTNPGNFAQFDCLNCHAPGPTGDDHDGVSGYIYESNACFACHPDGEG
ncbi:hypothetical protein [Ulvibacter antarcticus]|uniref:Uncharacterized protein n=1 Tax=Ulvibacter antarcticus TaxID=442714 RepID=A0A3L9YS03_9FLAO|nr:hypothetical protein [Ulvibacter antarcticus]RMA57282.1 hypothetical protein BXY75_3170 [Ulvibacter antarcticus]